MKVFFTKNLTLKVTALSLAFLLELYFYSPTNAVKLELPVPIEIVNIKPGTMITEPGGIENGMFAQVTIEGPRSVIDQLRSSSLRFMFDAENRGEGKIAGPLNYEDLDLPSSVKILEIVPSTLELEVDKLLKWEIPVNLIKSGKVKDGYKVTQISIEPTKIWTYGPKEEVSKIAAIDTETLQLDNLEETKEFQLNLLNPTKFTSYSLSKVTVKVVVEEGKLDKPKVKNG